MDKKLSEIIIEIAVVGLKRQEDMHSEVIHILMFLAHIAWNRDVRNGIYYTDGEYLSFIDGFDMSATVFKKKLISTDWEYLIMKMMEYKRIHYPDDKRFIKSIGYTERETLQVLWE
jgi:hypothetical protein